MQYGRWNHQDIPGGTQGSAAYTHTPSHTPGVTRSGKPYARSAAPSRYGRSKPYTTHSHAPSRGNYGGSRGGYGGSPRGNSRGGRGGRNFGTFGETEAEFSRFINKAEITEKVEHFVPEHAFADFAIDERLKANIVKKGYVNPTPIQDRAISHILRGEDVVGLAETGTGKTAAFLIPLIDKVIKNSAQERILIMAPTRELAVQIEKELAGFARGLGFRGMVAVGGANIQPQISMLRHNPSFVIGTPGRLKDLIERGALNLSGFSTVVLDEADRMLDMGFIDDMRLILSKMHSGRHTIFFSATMGKDIERLIGDFSEQPAIISVKTRDTSKNVDQDVVRIPRGTDKFEVLVDLLKQPEFHRVLVFGRTKHGVEKLAKLLSRSHIHAESIHGNKSHNARIRALEDFKLGKIQALVATDVAARGLDIPAVSHVINFDLPSTYEDYVHRIGRTGRADKKGKALTFVSA